MIKNVPGRPLQLCCEKWERTADSSPAFPDAVSSLQLDRREGFQREGCGGSEGVVNV